MRDEKRNKVRGKKIVDQDAPIPKKARTHKAKHVQQSTMVVVNQSPVKHKSRGRLMKATYKLKRPVCDLEAKETIAVVVVVTKMGFYQDKKRKRGITKLIEKAKGEESREESGDNLPLAKKQLIWRGGTFDDAIAAKKRQRD